MMFSLFKRRTLREDALRLLLRAKSKIEASKDLIKDYQKEIRTLRGEVLEAENLKEKLEEVKW